MRQGSNVGGQLRRLRLSRRLSQLELALTAGVSARHVSFVETGRSMPGRDSLLRIASALSLTHAELTSLLSIAGYASAPLPRAPTIAQLEPVLPELRAILASLDPVPAALLDGQWDLVIPNHAYARFVGRLFARSVFPRGGLQVTDEPRPNRARLIFEHPGLRARFRNWKQVAAALLVRVRLEARLTRDPALAALAEELASAPELPAAWQADNFQPERMYPVRVDARLGRRDIRRFSIVNAWATSMPGLRIEMLHPVDERSRRALESLLGTRSPATAWSA